MITRIIIINVQENNVDSSITNYKERG